MAIVDVCLLTGQPGTGKSTLCEALRSLYPDRYSTVSIGGLIRQLLVNEQSNSLTEEDLRQRPTELVSGEVLERAHSILFETIEVARTPWVLVDSHAVSQDWFGFRSTPDGRSYFGQLRYSAIVQLYLDGAMLMQRLDRERAGRRGRSLSDLSTIFSLQAATSTVYASMSECPLYLVDSSVSVNQLVSTVDGLLTG